MDAEGIQVKAGLHKLTAAEYHADPIESGSLSASIAHELVSRSSLHAWHAHPRLNPNHQPEQNAIMDAGTVAHSVLLEGSMDRVVVVQAKDWKTNLAREQRDQAWANGGIPVLAGKLAKINAMVEAAKRYIAQSELAGVFDAGDPELTMLWQEGNAWCRARPDWLTTERKIALDYKSTATSAEPNSFIRQILTMGYDFSVGHYRRGFRALKMNPEWIFLVQENEPPYACSLIGMTPAMLDLADRKADYALTLWKNCMATGKWSGYRSRVCYAEPPAYAVAQWEERSLEEIIEAGTQA